MSAVWSAQRHTHTHTSSAANLCANMWLWWAITAETGSSRRKGFSGEREVWACIWDVWNRKWERTTAAITPRWLIIYSPTQAEVKKHLNSRFSNNDQLDKKGRLWGRAKRRGVGWVKMWVRCLVLEIRQKTIGSTEIQKKTKVSYGVGAGKRCTVLSRANLGLQLLFY